MLQSEANLDLDKVKRAFIRASLTVWLAAGVGMSLSAVSATWRLCITGFMGSTHYMHDLSLVMLSNITGKHAARPQSGKNMFRVV